MKRFQAAFHFAGIVSLSFSCPEAETRFVVVQKAAHHRDNIMNSSELIGYLEEDGSIVRLKKEIAPFIKEFYDGLRLKGGSAPIIITIENKDVPVGPGHLKRLCLGYLDGILDVTELEYIASALDISPDFKFSTNDLRESIRELSDLHESESSEVLRFVRSILQSIDILRENKLDK
jgi:hypothetical protein